MLIKYNDYYANFNLNNDSVVVDCKGKATSNYGINIYHKYQFILNVIVEHQTGNLNTVYREEVETVITVSDNENDKPIREDDRCAIKKQLIEKGHMIVDHIVKEWKKDPEQIMDLNSFLGKK